MESPEQIYTYRITRKVRTGGSGCLACLFFAASILCFIIGFTAFVIILWPLALILFGIAWAVDTKTALVSSCGHCGNVVAHTSRICPVCSADLAPEPMHWTSKLFYILLTTAVLALAIYYLLR